MQNGLLPAEYIWWQLFEAWLRKCGHIMALAGAPGPCLSGNLCWAQLSPAQPSLLTYQAGVQPLKAPQGLQDFVRDKAGLLCPSQNHAQWARGRQFGPPPWDIWPRGDFF